MKYLYVALALFSLSIVAIPAQTMWAFLPGTESGGPLLLDIGAPAIGQFRIEPPGNGVIERSIQLDRLSDGFLFFPSTVSWHEAAGWASGGLLLAAGVVGAIHAYDLMSSAHAYRDKMGIDDEEDIGSACSAKIRSLWGEDTSQALRWTHVGLLMAGESFYLSNVFTGIQFWSPDEPGITRAKVHRWAFFVHSSLMIAEMILGFYTTEALRTGDHQMITSVGVAHTAIGFAIPVVILGSGAAMSLPIFE